MLHSVARQPAPGQELLRPREAQCWGTRLWRQQDTTCGVRPAQVEAFVEEAVEALKEAAAAAAEEASATSAAEQAASAASVSADLSQAAASMEQAAQAAQGAADTDVVEAIQSAVSAIASAASTAQVGGTGRRAARRHPQGRSNRGQAHPHPLPALETGSPPASASALAAAVGAPRNHGHCLLASIACAGAGAAGACGGGAGGEAGLLIPVHHRPRHPGRWVGAQPVRAAGRAGRVQGVQPGGQSRRRECNHLDDRGKHMLPVAAG